MIYSWEPGKFPTRCFLGKDPQTQCSISGPLCVCVLGGELTSGVHTPGKGP